MFKNFFFKKKDIVLDCFTYNPTVYDNAKINYGSRFLPEWWKDTPRTVGDNHLTIKNCVGLIDFYKSSIVIPSWFEMTLKIHDQDDTDNMWYSWLASNSSVVTDGSHDKSQFQQFAESNGTNIKLDSPWAFRTKEFVRFTWTQPTWSMRKYIDHISVLPAVVDYKYQHYTNINFFVLNTDQPKEFVIESLSPLVMMHPMTEDNVIIKNHLVDEKEYNRLYNIDSMFIKDDRPLYKQRKRKRDQIDKLECPFKGNTNE